MQKSESCTDVIDDASRSVGSTRTKSRRFSRSPVLFASVQLDEGTEGFILNISEGGLCVQTAREIVGEWLSQLRFQRFQSGGWVTAQGWVVWRNEQKTIAGVELVDLSTEARQEIRKWLSFGASLQELRGDWSAHDPAIAAPEHRDVITARSEEFAPTPPWNSAQPSDTVPAASPSVSMVTPENVLRAFPASSEHSKTRSQIYTIAAFTLILVAVSVIAWARWRDDLVRDFRGLFPEKGLAASKDLHESSIHSEVTTPESSSAPQPPAVPVDSAKPRSLPSPLHPAASAIGAHFVLQVAALSEQENANTLAESLRLKNFPVFVSKLSADRFYRVLVGPYDERSLRQAKSTLKNEKIEAIIKHWSP